MTQQELNGIIRELPDPGTHPYTGIEVKLPPYYNHALVFIKKVRVLEGVGAFLTWELQGVIRK